MFRSHLPESKKKKSGKKIAKSVFWLDYFKRHCSTPNFHSESISLGGTEGPAQGKGEGVKAGEG